MSRSLRPLQLHAHQMTITPEDAVSMLQASVEHNNLDAADWILQYLAPSAGCLQSCLDMLHAQAEELSRVIGCHPKLHTLQWLLDRDCFVAHPDMVQEAIGTRNLQLLRIT
ncbi:hypothetical protein RI367_008455 [Sorochytrium milnesiophthora]